MEELRSRLRGYAAHEPDALPPGKQVDDAYFAWLEPSRASNPKFIEETLRELKVLQTWILYLEEQVLAISAAVRAELQPARAP